MSKTRRNKNHVPDKKEGKKTGSRPSSQDSDVAAWDEDEDEDSEDEDGDGDDWEPEWPDEGEDELQAGDWSDDPLMDR